MLRRLRRIWIRTNSTTQAEDLEQAGGDPQSKLKRLQTEHEEGEHNPRSIVGSAVNPREQDFQARTLLSVFRAWQALREKKALLNQALDETAQKQSSLIKRRAQLAAQVEKDKQSRDAVKQQANGIFETAQIPPAATTPRRPRNRRWTR